MINHKKWSWLMLFSRLFLFVLLQSFLAFIFYIIGRNNPWSESEKWWPFVIIFTNIISLFFLLKLFQSDKKNLWSYYKFDRKNFKKDLLLFIIILLVSSPISFLPSVILNNLLFKDPTISQDMLVRQLPIVASYLVLIMPITQGLVEIPHYFLYVMPKFKESGMKKILAVVLPSLFLGLQHIAVPLIFNLNFIVYRGLSFLPFALLVGFVLHKRPRLLPFFVIIHILMDFSIAIFYIL